MTYPTAYLPAGTPPSGGPRPGTTARFKVIDRLWPPVTFLGIYNPRDVCGNPWPGFKCSPSQHATGRAVDIGIPLALPLAARLKLGDAIAAALVDHAADLGVSEVIWWRRRWTSATGWRAYSGRSPHEDHIHVTLHPTAADRLTELEATGALTPNAGPPPPKPTPPKESEMFTPRPGKDVVIVSSAVDGWVLDLPDSGGADGAPVLTFPQDGRPDQRWNLVRHGDECDLVSGGNQALDAWYPSGSEPAAGTGVRVFSPHGGPQQRWRIEPVEGCSENHIVLHASGLVLEVVPGSPNGRVILAERDAVAASQRFRLIGSV